MRRDPAEIIPGREEEVVTIMGNTDDTDGGQWVDEHPIPAAQISNEEAVASALRELLDAR